MNLSEFRSSLRCALRLLQSTTNEVVVCQGKCGDQEIRSYDFDWRETGESTSQRYKKKFYLSAQYLPYKGKLYFYKKGIWHWMERVEKGKYILEKVPESG